MMAPTSESAEKILSVSNLSIHRDDTKILRNVSWEVRPGEHWAILGSNGSGKTSLLLSLTGYLMPTSGEIELLGKRFGEADWRELRERVGLVSSAVRQRIPDFETALDVVISGRKAMFGNWGRTSQDEQKRAEALLRRVRCSQLAERPWRVLSQGERQRTLIARALMAEPPLLILDEPCTGLDPVAREQFLYFLQQLAERPQGPSIILVTHHVEEIMPAFSHVLLMRQGRAYASGEKRQVLKTETIRAAFQADVRLISRAERYRLAIAPRTRAMI